jgi:DNA-binding transcriptional ArsR family regulator
VSQAAKYADKFSALADPTRVRVVEMLHERSRPVHELAAAFAISRPAISRHLRVLKDARLVKEAKQGRENVYFLQRQQLKPLVEWLNQHWNSKLVALKAAAEAPKPVAKPAPKPTPQMEFDL